MMGEIEYPGVAQLVGRDILGEYAQPDRLTS